MGQRVMAPRSRHASQMLPEGKKSERLVTHMLTRPFVTFRISVQRKSSIFEYLVIGVAGKIPESHFSFIFIIYSNVD